MASAPTPQPGILDDLRGTGSAILDALRARYLAGPPQGAPSAGPGSVLDQRNFQMQPLIPPQAPLVPVHVQAPPTADQLSPQAQYGDRGQEKRIDTSQMTSGLSGVRRAPKASK